MTSQEPRRAGRPQTISEDAIFRATYRVMAERGPGQLTLAAIASILECSPPALLKRFGSKRKLLLAFIAWSVNNNRMQFSNAQQLHHSPLTSLRACLLMTESPGTAMRIDPRGYVNTLQFYFQEVMDPEFHAIWTEWIREYEEAIITLLTEAISVGELLPTCNPTTVGRTLHAAMSGVGLLWAGDDRRPMADRLCEAFDTTLAPYCPARPPSS